MSAQQHELILKCYEAFNRRDLTRFAEFLHPDFEINLANSLGFDRGTYEGSRGLEEFFQGYWDSFESISIEVEQLMSGADKIVAIIRATGLGAGSGIKIDARGPHLWSFKEGKAIGLALYERLEDALAAADLA